MNTRQRMHELQQQMDRLRLADKDNIAQTVQDILANMYTASVSAKAANQDTYNRFRAERERWEALRSDVVKRLETVEAAIEETVEEIKPSLWDRIKSWFGR